MAPPLKSLGTVAPLKSLDDMTLDELLQLDAMPQQNELLQQEIAKAQARANRGGYQHSTAIGGAFGALAQGIDGLNSGLTEAKARAGLGQNAEKTKALRTALLNRAIRGDVPASPTQGSSDAGVSMKPGVGGSPGDIPRKPLDYAALYGASSDPMLSGYGSNELKRRQQAAQIAQNQAAYLRDRADKSADTAAQHSWQEQQNELNRKSQERAALSAAGRTQGNALAAEDRADLRKREASVREVEEKYGNITRSLDDLEKLVGEGGTFETFGPHNAMLEGLITSYATDMAKLRDPTSVAREAEVELEKKALFSPGLRTRNATALDLIRNAKQKVQERRNEAYKVRGLQIPGSGEKAQGGASVDDVLSAFGK